jgi:hypothetical protein
MQEFSDIGSYTRVPCKLIKLRDDEEKSHPAVIEAIAETLKKSGRNYLPLIIEEIDEDEYEVLFNAHVLEAARRAEFDFVWCILADDERRKQIEIEAKQRFDIDILVASEDAISGMLSYVKEINPGFKQVDPPQAAKAIVENRRNSWKSLNPITELRCKIGKKKLPILSRYFHI